MELVRSGGAAFERQAWSEAYTQLMAADESAPLETEDLERLARAADLIGRDAESDAAWARAYRARLECGDVEGAARDAFWLGQRLLTRGEPARGGGWLARARELLADGRDCVEQGYLLLPSALQTLFQGDPATAHGIFSEAAEIGERHADPDLKTLARLGRGRTLIAQRRVQEGIALLDEVMVAVTAREVSPVVVGIVYCAVIDACREIFDVRRAHEWTTALGHWCDAQPDMVAFRGPCLVQRAELMQLRGAWPAAMDEAQRASNLLSRTADHPSLGSAVYQQAELHRLRGELASAEGAYRDATRLGHNPQPGLAKLRLAQGQLSAATAAIGRALDEPHDRTLRPRLLAAYVEIMLAANDVDAARTAALELRELAEEIDVPFLHAMGAQAHGAVLLAQGDARAALASLRRASSQFQELEAPYEAARVRVLVASACQELGDSDSAAMELDAARWTFENLGALPDLTRLDSGTTSSPASGLTAREVEVIRMLAAGKTNRTIATELTLSEKTVARHVSNIFLKLGLSSRAAATAYAYEHDLVKPT